MIDRFTERALRALCDQIGAGRVRRENLRDAFAGILADLAGVSKGTIETAFTFMPPVALNALMEQVDGLWETCNKAGVKPPRQAIDEAIANTCAFIRTVAAQGGTVEREAAIQYLRLAVQRGASIPADQVPAFIADNITREQTERLSACLPAAANEASAGTSRRALPWLIAAGIALKVLL